MNTRLRLGIDIIATDEMVASIGEMVTEQPTVIIQGNGLNLLGRLCHATDIPAPEQTEIGEPSA